MDIIYWSICVTIRRGVDSVKGLDGVIQPAGSFTLLENMKIWFNIQVIIYLHSNRFFIFDISSYNEAFLSKYVKISTLAPSQLISAGLEPVLSHTEKLCIVSYEYQNKNHKMITSFISPYLRPLGANKTGFHFIIFSSNIRAKLSVIRCNK